MNLSQGAKKELIVLAFCYALLRVSRETNEIDDNTEGIYYYENSLDSDMQKMINLYLESIENDLEQFLFKSEDIPKQMHEMRHKTVKFQNNTMAIIIKENLSLDVLALYILYLNFCKRESGLPLDPIFNEWNDKHRYEFVINTLDTGGFPLKAKVKMYNMAEEIISRK